MANKDIEKVGFGCSLPADLVLEVDEYAEIERRSRNNAIEVLLRAALDVENSS